MGIEYYGSTDHPTFGPYSPVTGAVGPGELLFVSSQIAYDQETLERYLGKDVAIHTRLALEGLRHALQTADSGLHQVVKITALAALENPAADRAILNAAYEQFFPPSGRPARTYVPLPYSGEVSVSFDAIAFRAR